MDMNEECSSCKHTWYDHAGRFTEDERAAILRHRSIGCRVIGCGCESFAFNVVEIRNASAFPFDPTCEYGSDLGRDYHGNYDNIPATFLHDLHDDAKRVLPQRTYYEIRGKLPGNFGRDKALAWYYHPFFRDPHHTKWVSNLQPPILDPISQGFYIMGGYYA